VKCPDQNILYTKDDYLPFLMINTHEKEA